MTPQTTLAPNAPWPTTDELVTAIAAFNERWAIRLAWQLKAKEQAKKARNPPRKYQKVKP